MFERVLVAFDGSPAAHAALSLSMELAAPLRSRVTVAHVPEPDHKASPADAERPPVDGDAARRWLTGVCEGLQGADGVEVMPIALEAGHPAAELLALAEAEPFDLIAVGRTGRHGIGGFLFGSVAEKVVRRAPCSVAVVPAESAAGSPPRVLVGHDGSETSFEAVKAASVLAMALSAGLLVAHAVDYHVPFVGTPSETARELIREGGQRMLKEARAEVSAPLESVEGELLEGDPRAALMEAVRSFAPRLLVIGHRGSGGFPGMFIGSTTDALVREAACPVVVVKPASRRGAVDP